MKMAGDMKMKMICRTEKRRKGQENDELFMSFKTG